MSFGRYLAIIAVPAILLALALATLADRLGL